MRKFDTTFLLIKPIKIKIPNKVILLREYFHGVCVEIGSIKWKHIFLNILVNPKICLYLISRQPILFIYFFIDKAKTTPTHRFKIGVIKIVGHTRALEHVAVMW